MKPIHLAMLMAALSTFCLPGCSFAEETYGFRLPDRNEPNYGTWINKDYSGNLAEYAQISRGRRAESQELRQVSHLLP